MLDISKCLRFMHFLTINLKGLPYNSGTTNYISNERVLGCPDNNTWQEQDSWLPEWRGVTAMMSLGSECHEASLRNLMTRCYCHDVSWFRVSWSKPQKFKTWNSFTCLFACPS